MAAPASNSPRASSSTAAGRVRSPMPTSTQPLPMTSTSPPSSGGASARAAPAIAAPARREARVVAVDRVEVHGLALARAASPCVDADAAVHPGRRVAREQVVRQRREHEVADRGACAARLSAANGSSSHAMPPIRRSASSAGGRSASQLARAPGRARARAGRRAACRSTTSSRAASIAERLGQQVVAGSSTSTPRSASASANASCSWRARLHPEHVVEQQLVLVARRQPLELQPGPVEDHPAQQADLRADVRGGADQRLRRHRPPPPARAAQEAGRRPSDGRRAGIAGAPLLPLQPDVDRDAGGEEQEALGDGLLAGAVDHPEAVAEREDRDDRVARAPARLEQLRLADQHQQLRRCAEGVRDQVVSVASRITCVKIDTRLLLYEWPSGSSPARWRRPVRTPACRACRDTCANWRGNSPSSAAASGHAALEQDPAVQGAEVETIAIAATTLSQPPPNMMLARPRTGWPSSRGCSGGTMPMIATVATM